MAHQDRLALFVPSQHFPAQGLQGHTRPHGTGKRTTERELRLSVCPRLAPQVVVVPRAGAHARQDGQSIRTCQLAVFVVRQIAGQQQRAALFDQARSCSTV